MEKSIILLSGGLDSAVNLAQAVQETEVVLGLTFDYGQKACLKEIEAARNLLAHYGIPQEVIKLPFLQAITKTSLVASEDIPQLETDQLDNLGICNDTAAKVWVPNRNGLFINIAAAYADSYAVQQIVVGFNREEACTFPDNTPEFLSASNQALAFATRNGVRVHCYTIDLDKIGIVSLGHRLQMPFEYIWSCYSGGEHMCGTCESCQRLLRAMRACNIKPLQFG